MAAKQVAEEQLYQGEAFFPLLQLPLKLQANAERLLMLTHILRARIMVAEQSPKYEDKELLEFQLNLVKEDTHLFEKTRWPTQAKYPKGVTDIKIIKDNIID